MEESKAGYMREFRRREDVIIISKMKRKINVQV